MIQRIYKELLIMLGVFLMVWLVITILRPRPTHMDEIISIEREQELGDILDELQDADDTGANDTVLMALYQIKNRLVSNIGLTNYDYNFHLVKDGQVNAYATMGGHVYVLTGLIKMADSPEEVAAVMAHEIGHIENRHVIKRLIKELGSGILLSIITGGDPTVVAEIMSKSAKTVFDRRQETEADHFAYELLTKANIEPSSMAVIFKKIEERFGNYNENLEFLMSHPNINKRIKESTEYETGDEFKPEPFDIDWAAVKRNIN